jgi:hypothetical protein
MSCYNLERHTGVQRQPTPGKSKIGRQNMIDLNAISRTEGGLVLTISRMRRRGGLVFTISRTSPPFRLLGGLVLLLSVELV